MTTEQIIQLNDTYHVNNARRSKIVFSHGEGSYLYDLTGKKYLDLLAGIAVNTLGYDHPEYTARVTDQFKKLSHISNFFYTEALALLAKKLAKITGLNRSFFCNSGAEANEAAFKFARKWGKETKGENCFRIGSFKKGFHGRTFGALSATHKKAYQDAFAPLVPGFFELDPHDSARMDQELDASVCAVIVEPVQGESGIHPLPDQCLQGLRKLCTERKILLIVDEIQSGIGRTGKWFGFQHSGIKPDLITMAKGLAGGVPIGACTMSEDVAAHIQPGDHGSTFGGNALACAAGVATLEIIEKSNLIENARVTGDYLAAELEKIQAELNIFSEIRHRGLMLGADMRKPKAKEIFAQALEAGVVLNAASERTLRFVPPLILTKAGVDEAIAKLRPLFAGLTN
ncbi:aspartate aminotransferase family protein [bacterium]|nr:aspartate aminotransferase family protein [bacterium]